jgi:alanine dehydrogenase
VHRDPGLRPGINVAAGKVTHHGVAEGVGAGYVPPEEALGWS